MIAFQLSAETAQFARGMGEALKLMDEFTKTSMRTQQAAQRFTLEAPASNMKSAAPEKGGAGSAMESAMSQAVMGAQIQAGAIGSALQGAMAPIGQIQARMAAMTDRMGGAMVTLARRIDAAMRFDKVVGRVDKVNKVLGAPFRGINAAIKGLEQRFNVFGPTTANAFGLVTDTIAEWRGRLDRFFRFDDLIGKWIGFVGKLRTANQPFTERAAITGIQLFGSAILAVVGKGVPALLRLRVAAVGAVVTAPLKAVAGWMRLGNAISSIGDVGRKGLSKLFNLPIVAPIAAFKNSLNAVPAVAARATQSVKAFGGQILVALGVAGLAYKLVDFFKGGIKGASDLNETVNKTGVIFGKDATVVTKAANDMAAQYGTVKGAFMDSAGTIGQLLQGIGGKTESESARMSVALTKAAADAESLFHASSLEEATGKIASALRGQSEPISAWGIDVTEAAVKAEAARMGLLRVGQEMSNQAKVAARASLVVKGLAVAQGDLAATIDDPANAMKRFQGQITNLAADVGAMFLPALKSGLGALNDFAVTLKAGFEKGKGALSGFVEKLVTVFDKVGSVFRNFPLYWQMAVLKFREGALNLMAYIEVIPQNLGAIANWIYNNWGTIVLDAINIVSSGFQNLGTNIGNLWVAMKNFLSGKGFDFEWTPLLQGFEAATLELPKLIHPQLVSMQKEIDAVGAQIAKNEKERAERMKAIQERAKPPKSKEGEAKDKDKSGKSKEPGLAGAFRLGSAEAASAVAQYGSRSMDAAAKQTAKSAASMDKTLKSIERKLGAPKTGGWDPALNRFDV